VSDVAGKFALIDRGNCDFTNKVLNAQLNGAIGVIVANYTGDTAPLIMGGPAYTAITIPAIGVSLDTGNILKSQLTSGAVTIALAVANAGDTFAAFSSRGPAGDSDGSITLKPDIAAPGLNIPSVQSGVTCDEIAATGCISPASGGYIPGGRLLVLSGTSMATPHITGMMAIMRELHPDFSADEIKALAMNTAAHDVTLGANGLGPRFGARSVGAGRVDVALAATGNITAFNNDVDGVTAVTFDLEPTESGVFPHTVRIVNHTNLEQVVDLSIDTINDAPGVSFSIAGPPTITLPAFGSTVIKIAMTTDVSKMKRFRDPTIGTTSSVFDFTVAREYLAEESSLLKISKAGAELARLPLYAALRPHSSLTTTGMPNGAPASGTTNLTLTGQDVCTGTRRVEEPGCVADYLSDEVSLVSPFELQVTAARDTSLPGFANLHYAGVNYTVGADGGIYLFGIAAYGKWGSPSVVSYNICIDTNHDGLYDQVLFNTDTGSIGPLFGQPAIPTDGYFSALSDLNYAYFEYPLNFFGAGFVDTAVLDNNVMMMGVTAAHLGVAALAKINYGIAVCPGGDPLCTRFTLPSKRCTAGDALATFNGPYTYDPAHPGVDGFGDVLHQDLNGATLAVPYDTANLSANGSSGMLLLHHHNTSDKTAEVVVFDELFKDSFDGQ